MAFRAYPPGEIERRAKQWKAIDRAFSWIEAYRRANDLAEPSGLCPVCGVPTEIRHDKVTDDGRLIGRCGDAFTIEAWKSD